MSSVRCQVSRVMCQVSHVIFFFFFFGQSGGASRWRVCYQGGLPRLVYCEGLVITEVTISTLSSLSILKEISFQN